MSDPANIQCPIHRTLEIIGKRWTEKRFSELMRSLQGVTPKMLSQRLNELEGYGIIQRAEFAEVPPRVEYSLTEKGRDLKRLIDDMSIFGNKWLADDCAEDPKASSALQG